MVGSMVMHNLDENIIAILDKIADIRRAMLWKVSERYNLTPLQIQILQYIKSCSSSRNITPTDIVKELYVSKATTSSALKTLLEKSMIKKNHDENDSRSYYLTLTKKAKKVLQEIDYTRHEISKYFTRIDSNDKKAVLKVLTQFVAAMHSDGVIDYVALCFNCEYCTRLSAHTFQCTLTRRKFEYDGINVGCCNFAHKRAV